MNNKMFTCYFYENYICFCALLCRHQGCRLVPEAG